MIWYKLYKLSCITLFLFVIVLYFPQYWIEYCDNAVWHAMYSSRDCLAQLLYFKMTLW